MEGKKCADPKKLESSYTGRYPPILVVPRNFEFIFKRLRQTSLRFSLFLHFFRKLEMIVVDHFEKVHIDVIADSVSTFTLNSKY